MRPPEAYSRYEVKENTDIQEVAKKLQKNPGHMVIVVDDNKYPKGLVTQTDLVKTLGEGSSLGPSSKVEEFMNENYIKISNKETVNAALYLMNTQQINKLIVLDNGKFAGVLHKLDIIREAQELL